MSSFGLIAQLEHAKRSALLAPPSTVIDEFATLARLAIHVAPDVWLEATYGLGECARLMGAWGRAAEAYERVVQQFVRHPVTAGRLADSNLHAAASSLLGLVRIFRLSLTVPEQDIADLVRDGMAWAGSTAEAHAIRSALTVEVALHQRAYGRYRIAAEGIKAVLETEPPAGTPCDPLLLELRLAETSLLAGERPEVIPVVGDEHWLYPWGAPFATMLRMRDALRRMDDSAFRRARDQLCHLPPRTAFFDLELMESCLLASSGQGDLEEALSQYMSLLDSTANRDRLRNRSCELWHRVQALRLSQRSGNGPASEDCARRLSAVLSETGVWPVLEERLNRRATRSVDEARWSGRFDAEALEELEAALSTEG